MSIVEKCESCNAYCCRHVAVHIDKPKCKHDFDIIRWYLLHKNIWVSIDLKGEWLLEFRTSCRKIASDYRCGDYENRPRICMEYPAHDQYCERETDQLSYTHLFKSVEEFETYLENKGIDWRRKR